MAENLIAKKEFRGLTSSSLFKGLALVAWLFYFFGLFNGVTYFQENTETRTHAQEESYQQWLNQEDKGPHSAAHYGLYAFKPVPALSIMDKGMEDFLGSATWLEAHNQNEVMMRAVDDGNSLIKYNSVTVGFLWQFLLPLILLILTFNAVTKEKENGTLTMLLSTGTSGRYILMGKVMGILKAFMLYIFIPQVVILIITLLVTAGGGVSRELGFLTLVIVFYLVLYFLIANLSVYLSAIFKTSSQVLIVSIGFWVVATFILPRLYGSIAKHMYSTPSSYEFTYIVNEQRAKGMDGKGSYEIFQQKLKDSLFAVYKVNKIEDLPIGFGGVALEYSEKRDYAAYDKNYGEVHQQFVKQDQLMNAGALFSPLLAMRNLSFGLSETNIYRHLDFTNQAEVHRRDIATKMNSDIVKYGSSKGKDEKYKYNAGKRLWKTVSNFDFKKPSFGEVIANQWLNIVALLAWLGLAFYLRSKAEQNLKPV